MAQIRWTKAQVAQLYRNVRAFNAARTRAIKKNPEIAQFLPEKLNVQEERQKIQTRQELKALTADVNRELKFKFELVQLEDGTYKTRKQFEDLKTLVDIANRTKKRVAKKRGVKTKPAGRMGTEEEADMTLFRTDIKNIKGEEWDRYVQVVADRVDESYYNWEEERYKEQYIENIWKFLGPGVNTLELVEIVEKIPAHIMLKAARENSKARMTYMYPNSDDEIPLLIEELKTVWSGYA